MYQEEMEGLGVLARQVLDETHMSSRVSTRATQLTARYHALLLHRLVGPTHTHDLTHTQTLPDTHSYTHPHTLIHTHTLTL